MAGLPNVVGKRTKRGPILSKLALAPRPASAHSADGSLVDTAAAGEVPAAFTSLGLPGSRLRTTMAPKGGSKQQSEEDLLLQDFSRNLSAKSSALFFGNAFIVSAIPICERREQAGRGGRRRAGLGGDVAGPGRLAGVSAEARGCPQSVLSTGIARSLWGLQYSQRG